MIEAIKTQCADALAEVPKLEQDTLIRRVLARISEAIGYNIEGDEHIDIIRGKALYRNYFFLPYAWATISSIRDMGSDAEYSVKAQSGRKIFTAENIKHKELLVSYSIGGVTIVEKIMPLINSLLPLIAQEESLLENIASGGAIKNKKYEDLSITYVDSSEARGVVESKIIDTLQSSPIIHTLRPFYVY